MPATDDRAGKGEVGLLSCIDGKYRYRCEKRHTSVSSDPFYDTCTAVLPWPGGDPCGALIEYRLVDYRGEGG